MSRRISISLNFRSTTAAVTAASFEDGKSLNVANDQRLEQLLPDLITRLDGADAGAPEDYVVFVARAISPERTLSELDLRNGDAIHIVRVGITALQHPLQLFTVQGNDERRLWRQVVTSPVVLGRERDDPDLRDFPLDLDLSEVTDAQQQRKISRRQAQLSEEHGQWFVSLHEKANSPIYVDSKSLHPNDKPLARVPLRSGTVLTFGSLNNPSLRLVVEISG